MATFRARALLFDIDGTLLDSIPVVDRAWARWCERHGLNPAEVLPKIHGRRSIDSIREHFPHLDAEAEDLVLRAMEVAEAPGARTIAGAHALLASLPAERWALVTSGTSDVALSRYRHCELPMPSVAVFGEDVAQGKPAPDPYLLAAARLGVPPEECLVFEDTAAGVRSGHAAGMRVVAVGSEPSADARVPDLRSVQVLLGEAIEITVP